MLILSDDVENRDMPIVNWFLIVANVLVFIWTLTNPLTLSDIYREWGTVPGHFVAHHDVHDFLAVGSSMFLHGGPMHLLGNMWILFLFGDNVEERLGSVTYLVFYLTCGLFADLLQVFSSPHSMIPCIGASGAIAGVMGAYLALHPGATCKTWFGDDSIFFAFRTYNVPVFFIIGGWFALQVFMCSFMPKGVDGIAFFAHVGGFLAGIGLLTFIQYKHYEQGEGAWSRTTCAVAFFAFLFLSWNMIHPFIDPPSADASTTAASVDSPAAAAPSKIKPKKSTAKKSTSNAKTKATHSKHHPSKAARHPAATARAPERQSINGQSD